MDSGTKKKKDHHHHRHRHSKAMSFDPEDGDTLSHTKEKHFDYYDEGFTSDSHKRRGAVAAFLTKTPYELRQEYVS